MAEAQWHSTPLVRASLALHVLALAGLLAVRGLWPWIVALVVADHLLVVGVGLWPRSRWLGPNWTQLPAAAAARREIALTIDDGPDPLVTPKVLDMLDRYACRATFFCIGQEAQRHPDLCRESCAAATPSKTTASGTPMAFRCSARAPRL